MTIGKLGVSGFGTPAEPARAAGAVFCAAVLAVAVSAASAQAQSGAPAPSDDRLELEEGPEAGAAVDDAPPGAFAAPTYLDANEFRRRYENKTVHVLLGDDHYGSEYYMPGDESIYVGVDGACQRGEWSYVTPQFCFQYGSDGPHCWLVFDLEGETYHESIDGLRLRIYATEDTPLTCDPDLIG